MTTDDKIQIVSAQLGLVCPADTPEGMSEQVVVAQGVLASTLAHLVGSYGVAQDHALATTLRHLEEMLDTALATHSLN